jgi:hypothetical protein
MSKKAMNAEGNRSGAVPQGKKIAVNSNNAQKGSQPGKNSQGGGKGCC